MVMRNPYLGTQSSYEIRYNSWENLSNVLELGCQNAELIDDMLISLGVSSEAAEAFCALASSSTVEALLNGIKPTKYDVVNKLMRDFGGAVADISNQQFLYDNYKSSRPIIPLMKVLLHDNGINFNDPDLLHAKITLRNMLESAPCNMMCSGWCPDLDNLCEYSNSTTPDLTTSSPFKGIDGWKTGNKWTSPELNVSNSKNQVTPGLDYMMGYLMYHLLFTPNKKFSLSYELGPNNIVNINFPTLIAQDNINGNFGDEGTVSSIVANNLDNFSFSAISGFESSPFYGQGAILKLKNLLFSAEKYFDDNVEVGNIVDICSNCTSKGVFHADKAIVFEDDVVFEAGTDVIAYIAPFSCDYETGIFDGLKINESPQKNTTSNNTKIVALQDSKNINGQYVFYPNPVTQSLMLNNSSGNIEVSVLSLLGYTVTTVSIAPGATATIDVEGLPSGSFYVQLFNSSSFQYQTHKIIKL